jgi:hypothetical protein
LQEFRSAKPITEKRGGNAHAFFWTGGCSIHCIKNLPYFALTGEILSCCFDVMKEFALDEEEVEEPVPF